MFNKSSTSLYVLLVYVICSTPHELMHLSSLGLLTEGLVTDILRARNISPASDHTSYNNTNDGQGESQWSGEHWIGIELELDDLLSTWKKKALELSYTRPIQARSSSCSEESTRFLDLLSTSSKLGAEMAYETKDLSKEVCYTNFIYI